MSNEGTSGGVMMGAMLVIWTLGFISGYRVGADIVKKRRSDEFDPEEEYDGELSGEYSSRDATRS